MPCKFRIDLEKRLVELEEELSRTSFEDSKYDVIRHRKNADYQFHLSKLRKIKKELEMVSKKIEELSQIDSDLSTCEELDKLYDQTMKGIDKISPKTEKESPKTDKDLVDELFKELGME